MSEITVRFTEEEARALVGDLSSVESTVPESEIGKAYRKLAAALPPEYPEGTIAWVTGSEPASRRYLCELTKDGWIVGGASRGKGSAVYQHMITKVEPIRVLADALDAEGK